MEVVDCLWNSLLLSLSVPVITTRNSPSGTDFTIARMSPLPRSVIEAFSILLELDIRPMSPIFMEDGPFFPIAESNRWAASPSVSTEEEKQSIRIQRSKGVKHFLVSVNDQLVSQICCRSNFHERNSRNPVTTVCRSAFMLQVHLSTGWCFCINRDHTVWVHCWSCTFTVTSSLVHISDTVGLTGCRKCFSGTVIKTGLLHVTCLWTPTENCITWVRSFEAFHKIIDKRDNTLTWRKTHVQSHRQYTQAHSSLSGSGVFHFKTCTDLT